jgi:hypothetical protein
MAHWFISCAVVLALIPVLTGCGGESSYERGYADGYNQGQRDVCREIDRVASRMKDQLRNCRGF